MPLDFSQFKQIRADAKVQAMRDEDVARRQNEQDRIYATHFGEKIVDDIIQCLSEDKVQQTFNDIFMEVYRREVYQNGVVRYVEGCNIVIEIEFGWNIYARPNTFMSIIRTWYNDGSSNPDIVDDIEHEVIGYYCDSEQERVILFNNLSTAFNYISNSGIEEITKHLKSLGLKTVKGNVDYMDTVKTYAGKLHFEIETSNFFEDEEN